MKRIGILGDIGSGKSYIAKCFGFPVFNADLEVAKIYKENKKVFQKLKKYFSNIGIADWGDTPEFDMIINATSLGLNKEDNINLNFKNINKEKLFYDVIYNPKETNFLTTGKKLGCQVFNGKMMFIYQAFEAFKLWHKVKPEINDELKKFLDL